MEDSGLLSSMWSSHTRSPVGRGPVATPETSVRATLQALARSDTPDGRSTSETPSRVQRQEGLPATPPLQIYFAHTDLSENGN